MATEHSVMAVIRAARPVFRSRNDKVAFAVHATFAAAGYVLHATGISAFADDALYISYVDEVGIDNWNEVGYNYAFVYSHPEKGSKKVLVKCLFMNDNLVVDVLEESTLPPLCLQLDSAEYVAENGGTNYGSQFKNLGKLVESVNKEILSKLDSFWVASLLSQPSRHETSLSDDRDTSDDTENRYRSPHPGSETSLRDDRDWRRLSGDQDPYIPPDPGYIVPPIPDSGGSDLFPGPGAGMYPSRGDFGSGSMLVGPNDPMFFGGVSGGVGGSRGTVPPGARFDPYGPPGVPGFEPDRFARRPPGPGRGMHPDLHHFHDGSDFI